MIEILSPSNKRPGPDRDAYRAKQDEVLASDASLIEIDLLRGGDHVLPDVNLSAFVSQIDPPPDYLVLVSRAWKRAAGGVGYEVFPCGLREWLPCVPVPLKEGEAAVPLDLQFVANRAYAGRPLPPRRGRLREAPRPPARGRARRLGRRPPPPRGLIDAPGAVRGGEGFPLGGVGAHHPTTKAQALTRFRNVPERAEAKTPVARKSRVAGRVDGPGHRGVDVLERHPLSGGTSGEQGVRLDDQKREGGRGPDQENLRPGGVRTDGADGTAMIPSAVSGGLAVSRSLSPIRTTATLGLPASSQWSTREQIPGLVPRDPELTAPQGGDRLNTSGHPAGVMDSFQIFEVAGVAY